MNGIVSWPKVPKFIDPKHVSATQVDQKQIPFHLFSCQLGSWPALFDLNVFVMCVGNNNITYRS